MKTNLPLHMARTVKASSIAQLGHTATPPGFPQESAALVSFGIKFSDGGAHISRTMMLRELEQLLQVVPEGAAAQDYREAVLQRNVLGKTTDSTRHKSLRHLRELYALSETTPVFGLMRKLHAIDKSSLPLLAGQVVWSRDPLFRATTQSVLDASPGEHVETVNMAKAIEAQFPNQYSELSRNKIGRNAASSWTQFGFLAGRAVKLRQPLQTSNVAITMALFLGQTAGYYGVQVFTSPWVRLLGLRPAIARTKAHEAHRAGLLNLRAVGDVVDLSFPMFDRFQHSPS
jgi:hypothetical protein